MTATRASILRTGPRAWLFALILLVLMLVVGCGKSAPARSVSAPASPPITALDASVDHCEAAICRLDALTSLEKHASPPCDASRLGVTHVSTMRTLCPALHAVHLAPTHGPVAHTWRATRRCIVLDRTINLR